MDEEEEVGRITHYFSKIGVAIVELKAPLNVGDNIQIKGSTTDFQQVVETMQVQHQDVQAAKKGEAIGLKVAQQVRENDILYREVRIQ